MKHWRWLVAAFVLSACGVISQPDMKETLEAQNYAFVVEATAVEQTVRAQATRVVGTAQAAETLIVDVNSINQQLLATVRAGAPPTRQVIVANPTWQPGASAPLPASGGAAADTDGALSSGGGQFTDTVTTASIRDSDGCADGSQTQFTTDVERIYVVTRALNLRTGTEMRAEWRFDGQAVDSASWTANRDEADICVWFYLDSFSPGSWAVQLFANGAAIEPTLSFTVQ